MASLIRMDLTACGLPCRLVWIFLVLSIWTPFRDPSFAADTLSLVGKPTLPGASCQIPPHSDWTSQEKWVWMHVCEGKTANFNRAEEYGGQLDPKEPAHWPVTRILRPAFLETILLHEPWRSTLPRLGVVIVGARFIEPLDLSGAELTSAVRLVDSHFASWVKLDGLYASRLIALNGSVFDHVLGMRNLRMQDHLLMVNTKFAHADLLSAKIDGQLNMTGVTVTDTLNMDSLEVQGHLFMSNDAKFTDVNLSSIKVAGQLSMTGATVTGVLNMSSLEVQGHLLMRNGAKFADVNLRGAKVGGQLSMTGATVTGMLNMDNLTVKNSLLMSNSMLINVDLLSAKVGGQLDMTGVTVTGRLNMGSLEVQEHLFMSNGAKFADINLSSSRVGGQLDMTGVTVTGTLHMDSLEVQGYLLMSNGAKFADINLSSSQARGPLDMAGATVTGMLIMNGLEAKNGLFMRNGTRLVNVDLRGAKIGRYLDMTGATVTGTLNMNGLEVQGHLFMHSGVKLVNVDLRSAKVGGHLDMTGATVTGTLNMDSLEVKGHLWLHNGTKLVNVDLGGAKIGGHLDMTGVTVTGTLNMSSLEVQGHLMLRNGAKFADINLRSAKIAGQLSMIAATVTSELDMDSLQVGSSLFIREGNFAKVPLISITFAAIGVNLDLSGACLPSFDLTGTTIGGELRLTQGAHVSTWQPGAQLTLRNTKVGALQEARERNPTEFASRALAAWPETLELNGFIYDRLGGLTRGNELDIAARDVTWWDAWLRKQKRYSPQPYAQLAKVLRDAGRKDAAREILYIGKEHERQATCRRTYPGNLQSCELLHLPWLWLSLQKVFIGYGYRLQYALYWTVVVIVTGMIVLHVSGQGGAHSLRAYGLLYSIDMFLPIIPPLKHHYDISLTGWAEVYFYLHRFFGFFLASVLIASIPELLQKG